MSIFTKCVTSLREDISPIEFIVYVMLWLTYITYIIYCFIASTIYSFEGFENTYPYFSEGWSFLSRKKDPGDSEWQFIRFFLRRAAPWIICSTVISEILRRGKAFQVLQIWQIVISVSFLIVEFGIYACVLILIQPLIFAFVLSAHHKYVIWVTNICAAVWLTVFKDSGLFNDFLGECSNNYDCVSSVVNAIFWMNLKCTSYCIDFIDSEQNQIDVTFLSYCLYLPTVVFGPFISYKDFEGCYQYNRNLLKRILRLFLNTVRFLFWFFFLEYVLHFIYIFAIGYQRAWIREFDEWALCGYGYMMGHLFHLKYVISFGLSTSFSKFENVKVPALPACVSRVYLYSDMWRSFDVGLYNFLHGYIYLPLFNNYIKNPLSASLVCFIFIHVWHGLEHNIFVWTLMNYMGILIEHLANWIHEQHLRNWELQIVIGQTWYRRIKCVAISLFLIMSVVSNLYFIVGDQTGDIFVEKFLHFDDIWYTCSSLIVVYCMCQVSVEIKYQIQRTAEHQRFVLVM